MDREKRMAIIFTFILVSINIFNTYIYYSLLNSMKEKYGEVVGYIVVFAWWSVLLTVFWIIFFKWIEKVVEKWGEMK